MLATTLQLENAALKRQLEELNSTKAQEEKEKWQKLEHGQTALLSSLQTLQQQQQIHSQEQQALKAQVEQGLSVLLGPTMRPEQGLVMLARMTEQRVDKLEMANRLRQEDKSKDQSFLKNLLLTTGVSTAVTWLTLWAKAKMGL